ncbi:hypothetical protein [Maledivibacter halophilus]|uniref:Uncharacterized protein n=1 Tax=Maledivibacter halophilus TaxID=36842 RepID=A0A1T5LPM8_9FIRM|nr:hypothetical protein [Maledivibacter halophilus]SKC77902.1 hypothetical protein SAMN02194393_03201 [Maledivibacter halophilus]
MKNKNKFTDKYDPNYKDMLSSNVYNDPKKNKNKKNIIDKDTFENKKDHFNPSSWID